MAFNDLKTSYKDCNDAFYIVASGSEFKLYVEPVFRRDGTENHDGYFPRFYSNPKYAKAALTKYMGKPQCWLEINCIKRGAE